VAPLVSIERKKRAGAYMLIETRVAPSSFSPFFSFIFFASGDSDCGIRVYDEDDVLLNGF
jgi:hypothetical protein